MSTSSFLIDEPKFEFLRRLGLDRSNPGVLSNQWYNGGGPKLAITSPTTGRIIAEVNTGNVADYNKTVDETVSAWQIWVDKPAPVRGEIVRQIGNALREKKTELGKLISLEMGKILSEGEGEVQEYIDICDYAVGLSRMLEGRVLPSERPNHVLLENWNPLGAIGIISAFNFPSKFHLPKLFSSN